MAIRAATPDEETEIRTRNADGETLTSIAKTMKLGKNYISQWSKDWGLTWARSGQTASAAQTRSARAAEIRAENELLFAEESRRALLDMHRPMKVVFATGVEVTVEEPATSNKRDLMQIAEKAHRLSQEIADRASDNGLTMQKTMLGRLVLDIGGPLAAEARAAAGGTDDD